MSIFKLVNEIKESAIAGKVNLDPVRHSAGIRGSDGMWNAIKWIDNEPYRDTVQCLIFKDKEQVFLSFDNNGGYLIPGGSKELDVSDDAQVSAECLEEAHIKVTNVKFTGIEYSYLNKHKKTHEIKNIMKGKFVSLYVADFVQFIDGDFGDLENPNIRNGKFYPVKEVFSKLYPNHQKGIIAYYKINKLVIPKEILDPLHRAFAQHSQDIFDVLDGKKPLNEAKGELEMDDFEAPDVEDDEIDEEGNPKAKKKNKKVSNTDIDPEDFESPAVEEDEDLTDDNDNDLDTEDFELENDEDNDELGMDDFESDAENVDDTETDDPEASVDNPEVEEPTTDESNLEMDDFESGDQSEPDTEDPTSDENPEAPTDNPETEPTNQPTEQDKEVITNVNILSLTTLERAMADRRTFESFKDLYQKSVILKSSLTNYKTKIDNDILDVIEDKLDGVIELLDEYIKYKFGINNYEENIKTLTLFTSTINDVVKTISDSLNE